MLNEYIWNCYAWITYLSNYFKDIGFVDGNLIKTFSKCDLSLDKWYKFNKNKLCMKEKPEYTVHIFIYFCCINKLIKETVSIKPVMKDSSKIKRIRDKRDNCLYCKRSLTLSVFWLLRMSILSKRSVATTLICVREVRFFFTFWNIYLTFRITIIFIFQNFIL